MSRTRFRVNPHSINFRFKLQIPCLLRARSSLTLRQLQCGFTLKCVRDMIRRYSFDSHFGIFASLLNKAFKRSRSVRYIKRTLILAVNFELLSNSWKFYTWNHYSGTPFLELLSKYWNFTYIVWNLIFE